jgi:hypothetical protein
VSSETLAFSKREIGQRAFVPFAWPGIFAIMSRRDFVTVKPASVFPSVMVAGEKEQTF